MNTREIGDVGQAQAVLWFTENDYIVSVPLTESTPYDLIVQLRSDPKLHKIQCKRTTTGVVSPRTMGGNRSWGGTVKRIDASDVDAVWCSYGREGWLIPAKELHGRSTVKLGSRLDKFKVVWG